MFVHAIFKVSNVVECSVPVPPELTNKKHSTKRKEDP